jgi:hypothetical protein
MPGFGKSSTIHELQLSLCSAYIEYAMKAHVLELDVIWGISQFFSFVPNHSENDLADGA